MILKAFRILQRQSGAQVCSLKNDDLLLKNDDLLLKNDDLLLKNDDLLLKADDFLLKPMDFVLNNDGFCNVGFVPRDRIRT